MAGSRYGTTLEDVNGSFARFVREAPKEMRQLCKAAVKTTTFALLQRMRAKVPVGPDAPHIKDALDWHMSSSSARGKVGILEGTDDPQDVAHVALYNEYLPNEQAFMRPAAKAEQADFVRRMQEAIGLLERRLGSGTGI